MPEKTGLNEAMQRYRSEHMPKPEVAALMGPALEDIEGSGRSSGLKVGDKAPDFELPAADGTMVRLYETLKKGPVILVFYRGEWCAYCNLQLHHLQASIDEIRSLGAQVIAVSAQLPDRSQMAIERHELDFPVTSDEDFSVIGKYGLLIDVDGPYREAMLMTGRDLTRENADESWRLPAPGTYVIDQNGTIVAAFASPKYWTRMEPSDAVKALRELRLKR